MFIFYLEKFFSDLEKNLDKAWNFITKKEWEPCPLYTTYSR